MTYKAQKTIVFSKDEMSDLLNLLDRLKDYSPEKYSAFTFHKLMKYLILSDLEGRNRWLDKVHKISKSQ